MSLGVGWKRFWWDGLLRSSSKYFGICFWVFGGKWSVFFGMIDFNGRCEWWLVCGCKGWKWILFVEDGGKKKEKDDVKIWLMFVEVVFGDGKFLLERNIIIDVVDNVFVLDMFVNVFVWYYDVIFMYYI